MPFIDTLLHNRIDLTDPWSSGIDLRDIAVALSRLNRYIGHTCGDPSPLGAPWGGVWSVAQHSLFVGALMAERMPLDPLAAVYALLHDAHEAYVGDIASPVKQLMAQLGFDFAQTVEEPIQAAIHAALGLPVEPDARIAAAVKDCDRDAYATETALFRRPASHVARGLLPGPLLLNACPPVVAEAFEQKVKAALGVALAWLQRMDAPATLEAARTITGDLGA